MNKQLYTANSSVRAQYDISGRVCVITGGAGFLGIQYAEAIAEVSGIPVLFDLSQDLMNEATERVQKAFGRCEGEVADVTDEASLKSAVNRVVDRHGKIDVLINNAALTKYGCDADPEAFYASYEETDPKVWEAGLQANLTGVMLACKIIGPVMVSQRKGSIINIGSDVGVISPDQRIYQPDRQGYEGVEFNIPAFYSVTKAGVIHLTKHVATLWAPHNVRVNSFSPAGIFRGHEEGFVEKLASRIPMGRMASENEYKGAIVFLASDASSFMTGHNLIMDGGRIAW